MNDSELSKQTRQFSCTYDKNGYVGVLSVAGVLTADCLQEINMRLIDSMMDADFVVVNLEQVSGMDADSISLFCMASRTAYMVNKRLHLGCARPEHHIAASRVCSLNFSEIKRHGCDTHCFWLDHTAKDGTNAIMDMRGN